MPNWNRTLDLSDVFRADISFPEKRDIMVRRIRALAPESPTVQRLADQLATAQDGDEWDGPWDAFYDWADVNRVWIQTWPKPSTAAAVSS